MSQDSPDNEEKPERGRPVERLHIEGDWEEAVKKALKKPPPPGKPPTGKPPKGPGTKKPPGEERP